MTIDFTKKEIEILKIQMNNTLSSFEFKICEHRLNKNHNLVKADMNVVSAIKGILSKLEGAEINE